MAALKQAAAATENAVIPTNWVGFVSSILVTVRKSIQDYIDFPMIETVFAAYAVLAFSLFFVAKPRPAVAITCFAGWLLLPVGNFPDGSANAIFAYWITGTAVPSDMLLTKMWLPSAVALAGAVITDSRVLRRFRPKWIDVPMALWCLWPILQSGAVISPEPPPWIAALYLTGAWGAPWLLGRLYFSGREGARALISSIAAGLVVITPIALIEGALGPKVYGWFFETHPFRADGAERYVGFRPLGFFEDGNQYGIWVAITAFAAIWLWRTAPIVSGYRRATVAILGLAIAIASQSIGAILILIVGLVLCFRSTRVWTQATIILGILFAVFAIGYFSNAISLRAVGDTAIGRTAVNLVRSSGRNSIIWRVARDQNALKLVAKGPIMGTGHWDWWRVNGERPWGLALLILGQFGLVGLALAFGSLLAPVIQSVGRSLLLPDESTSTERAIASIIVMATLDAWLNSFFFYPAIIAAGALSTDAYRTNGGYADGSIVGGTTQRG
jgi:hypothetical protein